MKKWILFTTLALVLAAGCGSSDAEEMKENKTTQTNQSQNNQKETPTENVKKGYVFEYNGVSIGMDMEASAIIEALGEPEDYFEAPSCAFEGLDKTYTYGSFEIDTYEMEGKDYISCVYFRDDMIETPEGISLFMTKDDMIVAYGENYTEEFGMLVYEKEGMKLKFILTDDEITSIEYTSNVLEVE